VTAYLAIDDALQVLGRYGFHTRDVGLLASALARPATVVAGSDAYPTLHMKAAALLESVLRNHPLIDGNKRTGWTLMVLFLWINDLRVEMDANTAFDLVVGVAEGRHDLDAAAAVIAASVRPLTRPVV
jgi:death-on-curing protein